MGAGPVLIALPLEPPGGVGFDPAHAEPSGARYRGRIVSVRDAVQGGSDPEEIEIARPQALLLAPGKSVGGYTALPVAELKGVRADGGVALDETLPAADLGHRRGGLVRPACCRRSSPASTRSPRRMARWCMGGPGAASKTC